MRSKTIGAVRVWVGGITEGELGGSTGRARLRLKGISSEQILRGFACGRVFSKEGTVKSGRTRQKQASFEVWNLKSLTTRW